MSGDSPTIPPLNSENCELTDAFLPSVRQWTPNFAGGLFPKTGELDRNSTLRKNAHILVPSGSLSRPANLFLIRLEFLAESPV
jgi:hypothetical protein